MSASELSELTEVLDRVRSWSGEARIVLARRILETLERSPREARRSQARSVHELIGIGAGAGPAPDDQTIRHWIDEHRVEKYGR
jgi:hypothetical protein